MKTSSLKQVLLLSLLLFFGLHLVAQCHIHPNFRSIANMGELKAIYEIQLTIVGTRINGQQYTARGTAEICDTRLQKDCAKSINIHTIISDDTAGTKSQLCTVNINFVENSLLKKQGNLTSNYPDIQRKGSGFYATASDGTILTFSFIKRPICLK